jgi:hypothetical protein
MPDVGAEHSICGGEQLFLEFVAVVAELEDRLELGEFERLSDGWWPRDDHEPSAGGPGRARAPAR